MSEVTVLEAAEMLGVTRGRVHQYIKAGLLTVVKKVGPVRLIKTQDVKRFKRPAVGWKKGRKRPK